MLPEFSAVRLQRNFRNPRSTPDWSVWYAPVLWKVNTVERKYPRRRFAFAQFALFSGRAASSRTRSITLFKPSVLATTAQIPDALASVSPMS